MSRRLATLVVFLLLPIPLSAAPSLEEAMREVERIRGLRFLEPVRTETIERAGLTARLREQIGKTLPYSLTEYEEILRALYLVEGGAGRFDEQLFDLLEAQVLAFYDPHAHVYYSIPELPEAVRGLAADASMLTDSVMIHELTHALQDQRFEIGRTDLRLRHDWDAALAFHSVVEGEASLVMLASLVEKSGATLDDVIRSEMFGMLASVAAAEATIDPSIPRYFVESLKFPYLQGIRFVAEAYRRGGWEAVNRLYADPPRTSREVLHPEEYFARTAPREPFRPVPAAGAGRAVTERLGEFHWQFLLGPEAARGWVNDRVTVARNRFCEPTVLVEARWDDEYRAEVFRKAYVEFLRGKGVEPVVAVEGREVRVAYGADSMLADRFAAGPAVAGR